MHSFEVHSNESACRKSGRLGMEQVIGGVHGGSRLQGDQEIRNEEAEHGHAVYCNMANYGTL